MNFTQQSTLQPELWGSAAATALLGVTICFGAIPGLNWALWTAVAAAELTIFAHPRLGANRTAFYTTIAAAVILGAGAAVTTNDASLAFIFLSVAALLAVAARLAAGIPAPLFGVRQLVIAPPIAAFYALGETAVRITAVSNVAFSTAGARVLRGLAIAIPVVALFTVLLAGADPTLSSWLQLLSSAFSDWSWFPRCVLFCALGTASLGSFGLAVKHPKASLATVEPARFVLGDTERRIVIGSVNALFGLFLVLQAFAGLAPHETYAGWVHKGFDQLTVVASLSVILVAWLHHGRARVGIPWGTLALLAEVELLVASALYRVAAYERVYGYTVLRVWVTAYILAIAALVVLLAFEVARPLLVDTTRFVRRGALVGVATLAALIYGNPDAWVADATLSRYRTTGKMDVMYVSTLSLDAAPTLLRIADALPPDCAAYVRRAVVSQDRDSRWYEWSVRRARAQRLMTPLYQREQPSAPYTCAVPS